MSRLRAVLATGNAGKAAELSRLLGADVEARPIDVEEDAGAYAGNACRARAARAAADGRIGLGDDSGLEVAALDGEPGLHSARWAGPTDADRNAALLARLNGSADRSAAFVCSLAAALPDGREIVVTERVEGALTEAPRGASGFGYDPLFVPLGEQRTVAELSPGEKDAISHRGRASRALATRCARPASRERRGAAPAVRRCAASGRVRPAAGLAAGGRARERRSIASWASPSCACRSAASPPRCGACGPHRACAT